MSKPRILIPTASGESLSIPTLYSNRAYTNAIEKAGGIPILITRPDGEALDELIALADGILLLGGTDVDPSFYNELNRNSVHVDRERDQLEFTLLKRAMIRKFPVLGICRGMQVINVAFGGSLYQDIATDFKSAIQHDWHHIDGKMAPRNLLAHDVTLDQGSQLAEIVGTHALKVNSLHHQGIKSIGNGLRIAAHSPDGVIEAIEHETHPFLIGIQWHPEELLNDASINILESFIQAAMI